RRNYPRISWRFEVRFKPKAKKNNWIISKIKNISEGGCFVYSDTSYKKGQLLEVEIDDPIFQDTMCFVGEVQRVDPDGVALGFRKMSEERRREFIETIFFLLKREQ
ncbi:PilZ domain-containing protein, partial [Thermoproteota archaeon]